MEKCLMRNLGLGSAVVFLLAVLGPQTATADCGTIIVVPGPYQPGPQPQPDPQPDDWDNWDDWDTWDDWDDVGPDGMKFGFSMEEPTQQAVIAWNGREQLMVLNTEQKGSRKAKLMEIMPVPSRPKVTKGDAGLFLSTMNLLRKKHGLEPLLVSKDIRPGPGGEIIEVVKIGYHKIAVARVVNPGQFIGWANSYVRRELGPGARPAITAKGKEVINRYLREGYKYWIFDLIEARPELSPHVAIQYRFQTDFLYFPVRITQTTGTGNTKIELLVFTNELLRYFRGLSRDDIKVPHRPVAVSSPELGKLSPEINQLFGGFTSVQLRLWEIEGPIQSFRGDVQASGRPVKGIRFN